MSAAHPALQLHLLTFAGWMDRQQQHAIEYLVEENGVLREQIGSKRLRLTDDRDSSSCKVRCDALPIHAPSRTPSEARLALVLAFAASVVTGSCGSGSREGAVRSQVVESTLEVRYWDPVGRTEAGRDNYSVARRLTERDDVDAFLRLVSETRGQWTPDEFRTGFPLWQFNLVDAERLRFSIWVYPPMPTASGPSFLRSSDAFWSNSDELYTCWLTEQQWLAFEKFLPTQQ